MIEILTAFIIINILVHELAHKLTYMVFGIKSTFFWKQAKILGKNIPIGIELHPEHYNYPVRQHLIVAVSGFIGSVIVLAVFLQFTNEFSLQAVIIAFPFLLSLIDFKTILKFVGKDWNLSVKKAHLVR